MWHDPLSLFEEVWQVGNGGPGRRFLSQVLPPPRTQATSWLTRLTEIYCHG